MGAPRARSVRSGEHVASYLPYDRVVEIHLNFTLTHDELTNPRLNFETLNEVVQIDIDQACAAVPGASVKVTPGSVGKGAASWGVELLLSLSIVANMDGLIDLGQKLAKLVGKLTDNGARRQLVVRDAATAGVLAVGAFEPSSDLTGGTILASVCVTGGGLGIGIDARDIWVTSVRRPNQSVLLIATSASGEVLGSFTVGAQL